MSDTTSPFANLDKAAHEVVIELIRAGKISHAKEASDIFTYMLNHYRSEKARPYQDNKES